MDCNKKHNIYNIDNRDSENSIDNGARKKNKIKSFLFLIVFVVLTSVLLSFIVVSVAKDVLGLRTKEVFNEVEIPKGASVVQIAKILKNKDIIKYPYVFRLYSKVKHIDNTYREGKYNLNSNMSYEDIIYFFQHMTERDDVVRVMIPEGSTVNSIANILKETGVCKSKQEFLDAVNISDFKEMSFVSKILPDESKQKMICFDLEGYLFPDTYDFVLGENPKHIVETMLANFNKKVLVGLQAKIKSFDKTGKMNLQEVITFASIVQKESTSFDVMKKVASVFFNRLGNKSEYPRLQSDVTILYVESDIKPNLEFKNQDMYDSYNTYVCKGLPVGPICNPGLDAIKAVLEPDETDYNYFLTDVDNNYYWAKTFDEHNNNLYKASKVGVAKGVDTD